MTTLSSCQACDIEHWVLKIAPANLHDDSFPQIAQRFLYSMRLMCPVYIKLEILLLSKMLMLMIVDFRNKEYHPLWTSRKQVLYVDGEYYAQVTRGVFSLDSWTKQPKLCKCSYANLCSESFID